MSKHKVERGIAELPMLKCYANTPDGCVEWYNKLNAMYFFSNQTEIFDCFLISLNDIVFISYNYKDHLSYDFMQFVIKTLPENKKEKKRKFYKPTNTL